MSAQPAAGDRPGVDGRPPVIGIFAHTGPMKLSIYDMPATFAPQSFVARVAAAGCLPVLLPPLPGIDRLAELLDGLLLLAGPDIDPSLFSAAQHPQTRANLERDSTELAVLSAAIEKGLPLLGICRGLQLLNVQRGGTLHQHLPEILGHDEHSPGELTFGMQRARLAPGSRTATALQTEIATVPCHHHQAIDRLGEGLTATAWAEDGTIEAAELTDHPFAVAVQWHAEQAEDSGLFLALADAARTHRRAADRP